MNFLLITIALAASFCFALGLVLTQFGLRHITPTAGASISVPSTMVMFLLLAPWTISIGQWNATSLVIFVAAGIFFPAIVTLLNFAANKSIGPNLTGALGNLSPALAVAIAVSVLGESLNLIQLIAIVAVCIGVAMLFARPNSQSQAYASWALALPIAAACIRGLVQPAVKFGLLSWSNPFAAVTIGYIVSAIVILFVVLVRGEKPWTFPRAGIFWFAIIGVVNGWAVLLLFAALALGKVIIVAPIVATYPLFTMLLNRIIHGDRNLRPIVAAGIGVTVVGIALLLASQTI